VDYATGRTCDVDTAAGRIHHTAQHATFAQFIHIMSLRKDVRTHFEEGYETFIAIYALDDGD
jgi:hypothetical protein